MVKFLLKVLVAVVVYFISSWISFTFISGWVGSLVALWGMSFIDDFGEKKK
jgi:hypothetical protein